MSTPLVTTMQPPRCPPRSSVAVFLVQAHIWVITQLSQWDSAWGYFSWPLTWEREGVTHVMGSPRDAPQPRAVPASVRGGSASCVGPQSLALRIPVHCPAVSLPRARGVSVSASPLCGPCRLAVTVRKLRHEHDGPYPSSAWLLT